MRLKSCTVTSFLFLAGVLLRSIDTGRQMYFLDGLIQTIFWLPSSACKPLFRMSQFLTSVNPSLSQKGTSCHAWWNFLEVKLLFLSQPEFSIDYCGKNTANIVLRFLQFTKIIALMPSICKENVSFSSPSHHLKWSSARGKGQNSVWQN